MRYPLPCGRTAVRRETADTVLAEETARRPNMTEVFAVHRSASRRNNPIQFETVKFRLNAGLSLGLQEARIETNIAGIADVGVICDHCTALQAAQGGTIPKDGFSCSILYRAGQNSVQLANCGPNCRMAPVGVRQKRQDLHTLFRY